MDSLASCEMCVVEVSLEPENLRVKLGYYAEAVKKKKTQFYTPQYNYPLPTPDPDDLQDIVTVLMPTSMVHDFEVGDYIRMSLSKLDEGEVRGEDAPQGV